MAINENGVDVCVWIAKDQKGECSNTCAREAQRGHVSLKIYASEEVKRLYPSLIQPSQNYINISLWSFGFVTSHEADIVYGGGKPNAIIRLSKLDIPKMLQKYAAVQETINAKTPEVSSISENGADFVFNLLDLGGVFKRALYGCETTYLGPSRKFYTATNCHLEDFSGESNKGDWVPGMTSEIVHKIAVSSAEYDEDDKKQTLLLMKSDAVAPTSAPATGAYLTNLSSPLYAKL